MTDKLNSTQNNIPYDQIDANIVGLVKFLNGMPGISTLVSCGGHKDPEPHQAPENAWDIFFEVEFNRQTGITAENWKSFERLVYCISDLYKSGHDIFLSIDSELPGLVALDGDSKSSIIYRLFARDFPCEDAEFKLKALVKEITDLEKPG